VSYFWILGVEYTIRVLRLLGRPTRWWMAPWHWQGSQVRVWRRRASSRAPEARGGAPVRRAEGSVVDLPDSDQSSLSRWQLKCSFPTPQRDIQLSTITVQSFFRSCFSLRHSISIDFGIAYFPVQRTLTSASLGSRFSYVVGRHHHNLYFLWDFQKDDY